MTEDVELTRAKFMEKRQKEIDALKAKKNAERKAETMGTNNSPAVRGTDGLRPDQPEQDPLKMAKTGDAKTEDGFDASSAARELASANGIDLADVVATGQNGKITKTDVQTAIDARN